MPLNQSVLSLYTIWLQQVYTPAITKKPHFPVGYTMVANPSIHLMNLLCRAEQVRSTEQPTGFLFLVLSVHSRAHLLPKGLQNSETTTIRTPSPISCSAIATTTQQNFTPILPTP